MKKIFIVAFSFIVLFAGQNAFASSPWNGASNDCPTVAIANASTGYGVSWPCWPLTTVSATAGQTVNVRIYYHNTSTANATNVKVTLSQSSTGPSNAYSFSGVLKSDQGDLPFGGVVVNSNGAQGLTFGSALWYPNQSTTNSSSFPAGQNGSEIMTSNGVYLGTVAPGWGTQGSIVISFQVAQPPTCSISNLTASPNPIIAPANTSHLTWTNSNCTSVTISPSFSNGSNSVTSNASGDVWVTPTSTTTYTITGTNGGSSDSKSVTVTFGTPPPTPCVINTFTANPSTITLGSTSTLSWTTNGNCSSYSINGSPVSGSSLTLYPYPTTTTTYNIVGYGATGTTPSYKSTTVTVNTPALCDIYSFYANPTTITQGGSSTLNWVANSNCTGLTISQGVGSLSTLSGSVSVSPSTTTTYTISSNGVSKSATVIVNTNTPPPTACDITSFFANPSTITLGSTSTLNWTTNGACTSYTINGSTVYGSSLTLYPFPTTTTVYNIVGYGASGTTPSYKSTTVNVGSNNNSTCSITSFAANPSTISSGGTSTLSWVNSNCTTVNIIPNVGSVSTLSVASKDVSPTTTTTYTIIGYGANSGTPSSKTVTVTVNNSAPTGCVINNFYANPQTINANNSSMLYWTTNGACTSYTINGTLVTGSSQYVTPSATTTYVIVGSGANNSSSTLATTVTVNNASTNCTISSFTASPSGTVTSGSAVVLSWNTNGTCGQTYINGNPVSSLFHTVYPTANTCYVLSIASGPSSSVCVNVSANNNNTPTATTNYPTNIRAESARISGYVSGNGSLINGWLEFPCFGAQYGHVYGVNSATLNSTIYSLSENRTYSYCAVAENTTTNVIVRANQLSFRTDSDDTNNSSRAPSVSTYTASSVNSTSATLNGYVNPNSSRTKYWFRYGTNSGYVNSYLSLSTNSVDIGTGSQNVSEYIGNLTPNTTYYFQAVAQNTYGTEYGSVQQFTTSGSYFPNSGQTQAVTTIATNVTQTSATLNGLLVNTSNLNTNTYFEYGTTNALGGATNPKFVGVGTSVPFSDYISGLSSNTLYFFRAVAENANGKTYGSLEIFRTPGTIVNTNTTTTRTVYVNTGVTRVGMESPIVLKIENQSEVWNVGDMVNYTVTYQNIGDVKLSRPLLQVILPKYVTFVTSSRGTFANENSVLNVPLEDLEAKAGGVVYLQARVNSLPDTHSNIVTTALLVYTSQTNAQENAMAYVLNHDNGSSIVNNLGASAGFLNFWGFGLIGWLLLLILILLIILISRTYRRRYDDPYYAPYGQGRGGSNSHDNH